MRRTLLLLVLVFSMGIFGASAQAQTAVSGSKGLLSGDIIASVNAERTARGLPAYKENNVLSRAAELKVKSLVQLKALQHTQSQAGALWWPLVNAGYEYVAVGENLAQGIEDTNELVVDWMNSPTHRANIVNPIYTEIGVSVMTGTYDGYSVSYVVLYAATPKPASVKVTNAFSVASKDEQIQLIMKKIIELLNLIIQMKAQGLS